MADRAVIALLLLPSELSRSASEYLGRRGYEVRCADTPWEVTREFAKGPVDVAVAGPGDEALELLRQHASQTDALFLVLNSEQNVLAKVLLLELGAADVVDATVSMREIAARVDGLLRRKGHHGRELLVLENSTVDLRAALVMHKSGTEDLLSPGQVALLRLFASRPGAVLSRDDIMTHAPAETAEAFDRSIDSRIVRLRRRLNTETIVTVRGAGYRFDPPGA